MSKLVYGNKYLVDFGVNIFDTLGSFNQVASKYNNWYKISSDRWGANLKSVLKYVFSNMCLYKPNCKYREEYGIPITSEEQKLLLDYEGMLQHYENANKKYIGIKPFNYDNEQMTIDLPFETVDACLEYLKHTYKYNSTCNIRQNRDFMKALESEARLRKTTAKELLKSKCITSFSRMPIIKSDIRTTNRVISNMGYLIRTGFGQSIRAELMMHLTKHGTLVNYLNSESVSTLRSILPKIVYTTANTFGEGNAFIDGNSLYTSCPIAYTVDFILSILYSIVDTKNTMPTKDLNAYQVFELNALLERTGSIRYIYRLNPLLYKTLFITWLQTDYESINDMLKANGFPVSEMVHKPIDFYQCRPNVICACVATSMAYFDIQMDNSTWSFLYDHDECENLYVNYDQGKYYVSLSHDTSVPLHFLMGGTNNVCYKDNNTLNLASDNMIRVRVN